MPGKKNPEDLTVDELRHLLIEKRRAAHQDRLEQYRRTGRVVDVAPEPLPADDLSDLHTDDWDEPSMQDHPSAPPPSRRKRVIDRFLFVVEIIAVVGFLFILLNGFSLLRNMNNEVGAALRQSTITPTPLVTALVLPSGHTPPDADGVVYENNAEIPEHLRPLVASLPSVPVPTPGPEQAIRIQIPAIGVDAPVVQGDGWEQLKKGVAQHLGTPNPGENGNLVLSAHNDAYGEIFRNLDQLKEGDQILLFTNQRVYTYVVKGSQVVQPTQVEVMTSTSNPVVTLISCYPYLVDNQRIVVSAELQSNS